jgi:hypothetical protein
VLSLIGLKMVKPSQSVSGFRFHSLHEQLAVSKSQEILDYPQTSATLKARSGNGMQQQTALAILSVIANILKPAVEAEADAA